MRIVLLHNSDHDVLEFDPGREARKDVVQVSGRLAHALREQGLDARPFALGQDLFGDMARLQALQPDLAVNLCESLAADSRGEMAIPCLLEVAGIPYTGSPALALGLALYKDKAKELLQARKVRTPEFRLVSSMNELVEVDLPFPLIVKPVREDASVGITQESVVLDRAALGKVVSEVLRTFHQPALVEQFIVGREIYVPILGNPGGSKPRRTLPLSEIHFGAYFEDRPKVVTYRAKWDVDSEEYVDSPSGLCNLDRVTEARVVKTALAAFDALGCRDYGRIDLRVSTDGVPYVIDVNPNCDLHPEAGFARSATAAGISYGELAQDLVEMACSRSLRAQRSSRTAPNGHTPHRAPGHQSLSRAAAASGDLHTTGSRLRG